MFWKKKPISEGAKGLIHSLTNTPENWHEWEFKYTATGKTGKEPELWEHKSGTLVYCSKKALDKSINDKQLKGISGFVVIEPHVVHFPANESKLLMEAFEYMISKKAALSVLGDSPVMTYAELLLVTEELIKNNQAYCLTSPNEKLREWVKRLMKDKK